MCSPSAPAAPDPIATSQAQAASNAETARLNATLNRVNQVTPYGNLTYKQNTAPVFDEAGYNKAYEQWNSAPAEMEPIYSSSGSPGESQSEYQFINGYKPAARGDAPTKEQFTTPGSDDWTATVSLTPQQQALLDADNRVKTSLIGTAEQGLNRVQAGMNTPFDTSQLTEYGNIPQSDINSYTRGLNGGEIQSKLPGSDYGAQRSAVEQAFLSRMNPQLQRSRAALEQRLSNQGISLGSDAYKEAIGLSDQQANDAYAQAVLMGGQEQSRLAGLDLQAGNFANSAQQQNFGQQATNANLNNSVNSNMFNQQLQSNQQAAQQRQQQIQEQSYMRSLPLNELNALRTGAQVQNPTFSSVPQTNVQPTDVSGNMWNSYNAQVGNANAQAAASNSAISSGTSAAMTAAMAMSMF